MLMNPSIYSLAFIEGIGGPELMMIFFVVLLLFGGQKLPELARGLGKSVREFKKATAGVEEEIKKAMEAPAETPKPKLETKPAAEPKNSAVEPTTEK
jgi:sec-independent protein translocase protein TatA